MTFQLLSDDFPSYVLPLTLSLSLSLALSPSDTETEDGAFWKCLHPSWVVRKLIRSYASHQKKEHQSGHLLWKPWNFQLVCVTLRVVKEITLSETRSYLVIEASHERFLRSWLIRKWDIYLRPTKSNSRDYIIAWHSGGHVDRIVQKSATRLHRWKASLSGTSESMDETSKLRGWIAMRFRF